MTRISPGPYRDVVSTHNPIRLFNVRSLWNREAPSIVLLVELPSQLADIDPECFLRRTCVMFHTI
jgi:hypothetical protein